MTDQEALARGVALLPELKTQVTDCLKRDAERDVNWDLCIFNLSETETIIAALEAAERIAKLVSGEIKP